MLATAPTQVSSPRAEPTKLELNVFLFILRQADLHLFTELGHAFWMTKNRNASC